MKRFYKLIAPVMVAASFPAMLHAEEAPTMDVGNEVLSDDQTPAKQWTGRDILMDTTVLNEKIDRIYTDDNYLDALKDLVREDRDNGLITGNSYSEIDAAAYLTLLEATVNPAITAEMLAAQPDLDNRNPEIKTLDQNYELLLECRSQAPNIENLYLKHQHIRGCAMTAINAPPPPEPVIVHEGIAGITANALAAPYSLAEKLRAYQSDEDMYDGFQEAIRAERGHLVDNDYMADMYNRDAIRFADFILDTTVNYDSLSNIPDGQVDGEREFKWREIGTGLIDNNIKFVQSCRDDIVPDNAPTDINERQSLLDEVVVCAQNTTRAADRDLASFADNVEIDPSSLFERHHSYKAGLENNALFTTYTQNVRTIANQSEIISSGTNYYNAMRLWNAMLDTSVTWDDLKTIRNDDDPHDMEFNWHTDSPGLDRNLKFMFECRAQHVPDDLSKTNMSKRRAAFNAVTTCWKEKNAPHAERINQQRAEARAQRQAEQREQARAEAARVKEKNDAFFDFVKIIAALGLLGGGGYTGYRVWKNRPQKPKKLNW